MTGAAAAAAIIITPIRTCVVKKVRVIAETESQSATDKELLKAMKEQQELLQQLQKDVEEIKFNDTKRDKADICVLRNMITQMYYDYLDERTLPIYIRENLVHLYEEYEKKHGNSYVKQIYTEMLDWDISNL